MSTDTLAADLRNKAGVLRNLHESNERLAVRLEERAARLELVKERKELGVSGSDRYPLDSQEAGWALGERVLRKIDTERNGEGCG